jgi:hypothetical protein
VGAIIRKRLATAGWGEKTVDELAEFIQRNHPELKGFNRRGLYRMKQFYETYASATFVVSVPGQIQIGENEVVEIVPLTADTISKRRIICARAGDTIRDK